VETGSCRDASLEGLFKEFLEFMREDATKYARDGDEKK